MKKLACAAAAIGLALALAPPAEAATKKRHPPTRSGAHAKAMAPGWNNGQFQGGVLKGPLYNGQDYLGDDPDPNIRAYLLRDLGSRYGGGY